MEKKKKESIFPCPTNASLSTMPNTSQGKKKERKNY
jgi:hypothetical protein